MAQALEIRRLKGILIPDLGINELTQYLRSSILATRLTAPMVVVLFTLNITAEIDDDWYIKARFASEGSSNVIFSDLDCTSESPIALYGCGTGGDGHPYRSVGKLEVAPTFEIGIGKRVAPRIRLEALLGHHPSLDFRGRTNFLNPDELQAVDADLSAMYASLGIKFDLPVLEMHENVHLVPNIGLGIGIGRLEIGDTNMTFPMTSTTVPGGRHSDFVWCISTGVGLELTSRAVLEIDVRYMDLGEVRSARGPGKVVWRDGSRPPLPLDLAPTYARVKTIGFGVSLRFRL